MNAVCHHSPVVVLCVGNIVQDQFVTLKKGQVHCTHGCLKGLLRQICDKKTGILYREILMKSHKYSDLYI